MDGLLIDSEPFWRRSHVEVLGKYGFVITEEDARLAAGKRTRDQVELWHERFGWQDPSIDDVTKQVVDNVINLIHVNGKALPGVDEVVNLMTEHDIPMAVASSSSQELIEVVVERLDLTNNMKVIVSAENEKRGKPFPDVFLTAASKLDANPENCLVFEDSINGIKAAKSAGMKCIAVPEQPYEQKSFSEADIVLQSLFNLEWRIVRSLWPEN